MMPSLQQLACFSALSHLIQHLQVESPSSKQGDPPHSWFVSVFITPRMLFVKNGNTMKQNCPLLHTIRFCGGLCIYSESVLPCGFIYATNVVLSHVTRMCWFRKKKITKWPETPSVRKFMCVVFGVHQHFTLKQ